MILKSKAGLPIRSISLYICQYRHQEDPSKVTLADVWIKNVASFFIDSYPRGMGPQGKCWESNTFVCCFDKLVRISMPVTPLLLEKGRKNVANPIYCLCPYSRRAKQPLSLSKSLDVAAEAFLECKMGRNIVKRRKHTYAGTTWAPGIKAWKRYQVSNG